jgi:hypothetical protein
MGREGKLAVGVLLLVVSGLVLFMSRRAPARAGVEPLINPTAMAAVFGLPGLALLVLGVLPPRDRRATMEFSPGRLFGGLGISLAGIVILYLYHQVFHVAPLILLVGAGLAVPVGLLFAASCWTEATANAPHPRSGPSRANARGGSAK